MAVKTTVDYAEGMYFITITCQDWLPLFEITNRYDTAYKWFDCLKTKDHHLRGYVIMPNHLHVLIEFNSAKSINIIVSNGKRFMAYTIVERLKEQNDVDILLQLSEAVSSSDKDRGKIYQVFERSFDCKKLLISISICKSFHTYITILAVVFGNL